MNYTKQIAIQAALEAWAMSGDIYKAEHVEHLIDLDAIIASVPKPEPVGETRVVPAASYPGATPHFRVSWKDALVPQFETKLYAEPVAPSARDADRLYALLKRVHDTGGACIYSQDFCDAIDAVVAEWEGAGNV